MDSSKAQIVSKQSDSVNSPMKTSRRSLSSSSSFSSFSSCSSSFLVFPGDSPLNSPATPLSLLGVPFSWEHIPGKPKDYSHRLNTRRNNESSTLLPLPPHRNTHFPTTGNKHKPYISGKKKNTLPETVTDPFAVALLECSKDQGNSDDDDDDDEVVDRRYRHSGGSSKTLSKTTSIGNRFGLVNLYGSCRRTCAVSESIVHLPRSIKPTSYDHLLLPRRRR